MTGATIVAGAEAAHGVEPGKVALDNPAMPAEPFAGVDAPTGDPRGDAARPTGGPALPKVVALVGVHLERPALRPAARAAFQRRDRVQHRVEDHTVIYVRRREERGKRNAFGVDHKMALAARSALIRRIRADDVAPLFAATVELSRAARLQSISSAQLSSCSKRRCNRFHTPRRVQVRKRRQHVEPLPHPISRGRSCHGSAVRRMNRIPVSACRFETVERRPPFFPGLGALGKSGSTCAHNASLTRGLMPHGRLRDRL